MVEPSKIRGYVGAHDSLQKPKDDVADPEKFKKVLKVESSSESEKREQRKKKRSDHEGETEEEADVGPKAPETPQAETAFSDVLSDKPEKDTLFEGGTKARTPQSTRLDGETDLEYKDAPSQGLRKTIYSAPEAPLELSGGEESAPPPVETTSENTPPPPAETTSETTPPPPPPSEQTQAPATPPQDEQGPPTSKQEDSSAQVSQANTSEPLGPTLEERRQAHAKKQPSGDTSTKDQGDTIPGLAPEKKRVETYKEKKLREKFEKQEAAQKEAQTTDTSKKHTPTQREQPPSVKNEKTVAEKSDDMRHHPASQNKTEQKGVIHSKGSDPKIPEQQELDTREQIHGKAPVTDGPIGVDQPQQEKKGVPRTKSSTSRGHSTSELSDEKTHTPLTQQEKDSGGERQGKDENTDALLDEIAATYQSEKVMEFTPTKEAEAPKSTLSAKVYELFEKMVGLITIQKINGVERTTVTVDLKGSVFDGAELILEKADTAQDTFNVELKASPEAVALFNQNADDLAAAFQKRDFDFKVHVKKASIQKRYAVQKGKGSQTS